MRRYCHSTPITPLLYLSSMKKIFVLGLALLNINIKSALINKELNANFIKFTIHYLAYKKTKGGGSSPSSRVLLSVQNPGSSSGELFETFH